MQDSLMLFDPAAGEPNPYPSQAALDPVAVITPHPSVKVALGDAGYLKNMADVLFNGDLSDMPAWSVTIGSERSAMPSECLPFFEAAVESYAVHALSPCP